MYAKKRKLPLEIHRRDRMPSRAAEFWNEGFRTDYPFSFPARFQDISSPMVDPVLDAGCLYDSTSERDASSPAARMLSPTFFSSGLILMILKSCSAPGSR